MNYRVNERTKAILGEVADLREVVEGRLGRASAAAREEWSKLRSRIPARCELESGTIGLSESELEEMKAKIARFAEILSRLGAGAIRPATPPQGSGRRTRRPS